MNVNAPQETSPPHEYLTFEAPSPEPGRRRATLPSIFANAETHSLDGRGKRLEPWDERRDDESIPSPQIGIALSSPPAPHSAHSIQSKRRSRSAGALRELARGRPSVERRRSAEIRYWRSSYASGSVYSTNTPRPRTAQTVETARTADTHDTRPTESATEVDVTSVPTVAQHDQDISQIQLPVDAFNFGNLKSGFSDDEDSEEPVAISPPARSEKRLSIEDRVKHLEENMRTLETSVRRLSGRTNRQTIILENAPKGRRSRNRSSSATSERQGSHHSSRSSNHTLQLRQQEASDTEAPPSPTLLPLSAVQEHDFPSSSNRDTVIAIEPRPSTAQQRSEIASQLTALHESLKHERHARKALEAQVFSLQRELADLHALVNKIMCTTSPSYPTPSPDAIVSASHEERMATPRASTQVHRSVEVAAGNRWGEAGSEKGSGGGISVTSSREDVTSPEAWATPKEESGFGSGFFGPAPARSRDNVGVHDDDMF